MLNKTVINIFLLCSSIACTKAESYWQCSYEHAVTNSKGDVRKTKEISGFVHIPNQVFCPALPKDVYKEVAPEEFKAHLSWTDEPDDLSCAHEDLPLKEIDLR